MPDRVPKTASAPVPDAGVRLEAETTFDRNVVVVAGAGTGKTTLLVNRLVNLLMREPHPVTVTQIVALTFTNKAAMEMKQRLREQLQKLAAPGGEDRTRSGDVSPDDLRARYGLAADRIVERASGALRDLEKAQIGTLHSFAAHLLRLHPIESGVDPAFQEDEGLRWDEHFSEEWTGWLDQELGGSSDGAGEGGQARWRRVLPVFGLAELRELAEALAGEAVSLDELAAQLAADDLSPALAEWCALRRARAVELLAAHEGPKPRKIEYMLRVVRDLLGLLLDRGLAARKAVETEARAILDKDLGAAPSGWEEDDFDDARRLIDAARRILTVDQALLAEALALLRPMVERVRHGFAADGWLSFDGLLARARVLLRDHPAVRERLKQDYRAILVDEFQDTDPVQYEIVLFLAEERGHCAEAWQEVALEPGKLFIVGDPKQSIYAFRRADIEAFERVVEKIRQQGGAVLDLTTNFRSHGAVLEVVNEVFDRLLQPRPHLQPPNIRLQVRPERAPGATVTGAGLRLIGPVDDGARNELESATVTRAEAETLARWLKEELLGREALTDAKGRRQPLLPGHVAILFRKLTQAQDYLDALRRHGIPYVTDGEKHYYRRQEVIDLVNLLRAIDDPLDRIALVGILRSPLGGLTDRELVELRERQALDYRWAGRLAGWSSPRAPALTRLYAALLELSAELPRLPLLEAMDRLWDRLPVLEVAAASQHGEQAVANLVKLRRIAAELSDRPHLSLRGFADLLAARLTEQPDEAESALAEESLEAVRVLTIHKAKGLEFPIVILAGLHHGTGPGRRAPVVSQDWSSGLIGLEQAGQCSLGAVVTRDKWEAREAVERRRLLYVGMTRARERLVLSGGLPGRLSRDSLLALIRDAAEGELGRPAEAGFRVGAAVMEHAVIPVADRPPRRKPAVAAESVLPASLAEVVARWRERDRRWTEARSRPAEWTATSLMRAAAGPTGARGRGRGQEAARLVGTLAHRVLEGWNFALAPEELRRCVEAACRAVPDLLPAAEADRVAAELVELLEGFSRSEIYAELRRAEILGKEMPFATPWQEPGAGAAAPTGKPQVMQGTLDLLYRLDGQVWIGDYKTDRVTAAEAPERAQAYRMQAETYRQAVERSLGQPVGFKFIFLRSGVAVAL